MTLHHGICRATGKRIYKRHQDAAKAIGIAAKNSRGCAMAPVSHYRCEACGRWHLSSMPLIEYQVRKLMREAA